MCAYTISTPFAHYQKSLAYIAASVHYLEKGFGARTFDANLDNDDGEKKKLHDGSSRVQEVPHQTKLETDSYN